MLNTAPFELAGKKTLLLADGEFSPFGSKTANCYIRYRTPEVVAVVDRDTAGRTAQDILGFGGGIPVVDSVAEGLSYGAEVAVVGIAPSGGRLNGTLRAQVVECLDSDVNVVSGLHDALENDREVANVMLRSSALLWDVRQARGEGAVGSGRGCTTGARVALTVGTDCNVGKMTTTMEIWKSMSRRGVKTSWAATGQTGIMLRGRGIAVDNVVSDFVSGATEELVNVEGEGNDWVIVEGQGAVMHPGFSGVALGLLHGAMPDAMVLVHAASRGNIADSDVALPPVTAFVRYYEELLAVHRSSRVVALAVNCAGVDAETASQTMEHLQAETGLPVCDVVAQGADSIVDALLKA